MTVHAACNLRGLVYVLTALALVHLWVMARPDINREALRGARTSGHIAFTQREGEHGSILERVDTRTADARQLRSERKAWMFTPTWSSDAKSLAVSRVEEKQSSIEILDGNGKTRRKLRVSAVAWLAWRPGTQELAVANSLHDGQDGLHLLDLAEGRWTLVSEGAQHVWLAWSADGARLAYSRLEPERSIYVLDLKTRKERVLCPGVIPAWDPSGTRLAVIPRERNAIELVDASSGRRSTLVGDISPGRLRWSPDGRWLLTDDVAQRTLLLIDVQTGAITNIGRPNGLIQGYDWAP